MFNLFGLNIDLTFGLYCLGASLLLSIVCWTFTELAL